MLMRELKNKYFELADGFFRVKDFHIQTNKDSSLVELDDYCGNFLANIGEHWYLNNDNIMFEASNEFLTKCLVEVYPKFFEARLLKEIELSIDEIKDNKNYCRTNFKKTPVRLEIIRKYYKRG
jgi:hypothetical protein